MDARQLAEMLKRYEEAAKPGKFHDYLKPLAGEFAATAEFVGPNGPETSQGYSKNAWVLGGRFLRQDFSGSMMGRQFHGISYTGYDNVAGKYQGVWMDEMATGMFVSEGEAGDDGRTITFTGESIDPAGAGDAGGGQVRVYRHVLRILDEDRYALEMYEPGAAAAGGEMQRTVTITYTRAKPAATQPAE